MNNSTRAYKIGLFLLLSLAATLCFPQVVSAATLGFTPNNTSLQVGCEYTVNLEVDPQGVATNAADVEISYNPSLINILDQDSGRPGVQIGVGDAYNGFFLNDVSEEAGVIRLVAGSANNSVSSRRNFASIVFITQQTGNLSFVIDFNAAGDTMDSNVADANTSNDLLTSVTNGSFTISGENCPSSEEDTTPPTINFTYPDQSSDRINAQNPVMFVLADTESGIDLASLRIDINGQSYDINSPEITYTGNANSYNVTFTPSQDYGNQPLIITVEVSDLEGNGAAETTVGNVIPSTTPGGVPRPGDILNGTPLDGSIVEDLVNNIGAPGTAALATGILLLANFLPLLTLLNAPGFLLNILGLLLGFRTKKPWGIITDAATGKPIPFASCRIYNSGTSNLVYQTVSDTDGRYGFLVIPGSYRLEISHSDYVQHTGEIRIPEGERSYVYDVVLVAKSLSNSHNGTLVNDTRFRLFLGSFFNFMKKVMMVVGFILSLISVITYPILINFIVFGLYLLMAAFVALRYLDLRPRYAAVVDSRTQLRLPYAVVKIFDLQNYQLVDTQITNANGQFDFWGEEGTYGLRVDARGYTFPSKTQNNYELVNANLSKLIKVNLHKGKNNIQIFVDPLISSSTEAASSASPSSNLATPFS